MAGRLAGWRALSGPEKRLFLGLVLGLPLVALLLRGLGTVRSVRILERWSATASPRHAVSGDMQAAQRLAHLAAIAGRRGMVAVTCLRQALLVHFLLRRRGLASALKIGVRKQAEAFDAHAWVELQGVALGQQDLVHSPFSSSEWVSSVAR